MTFPCDPRINPLNTPSEDPTQSAFWKDMSQKTSTLADSAMALYHNDGETIPSPFNIGIWAELKDIIEEFHDCEIPVNMTKVLASLAQRNDKFREIAEDSIELKIIK